MQDPTDTGKSPSTSLHWSEQLCVLEEVILCLGVSVDNEQLHNDKEELQVATQIVGMPLIQPGTHCFGH